MKKNCSIFEPVEIGADLETDHDLECTRAWICQWGVSMGDWDKKANCPMGWTGKTLDDFAFKLKELMYKWNHIRVWFHNFAYDDSYLHQMYVKWANQIQENGYTVEKVDNPFYAVLNGRPVILRFQFGENYTITFGDSLRKMNNSLSEIAEMMGMEKLIAPATKFDPGWSKNIDYSNMRYDQPDWRYVVNDAYIVAKFIQKEVEELHQKGATYSSDAFREGKRMVGSGHHRGWESKWER